MQRARLVLAALLVAAGCTSTSGVSNGSTASTTTSPTGSTSPTETVPTSTTTAPATTLPLQPFSVTFTPFVSGVAQPVEIGWRKGDTTLYLAEQAGRVVPIRNGAAGTPVLDIADEVLDNGEQGLLGLAFHPSQPFAYVDYIDRQGNTVIAEFPVAGDGTFDRAKERKVLGIQQPYPNHNGGKLTFDPKGNLYIGMGDGGSAGDPERRALNLGELLGKILRIDPLAAGGQPYTIPKDNPWGQNAPGVRPEIYAVGLRNPWRFAFDRANGDLWIADVGQNKWEEVDYAPADNGAGSGANFGWSALEGSHPFNTDVDTDGVVLPVWEYAHGDDGCSISGGQVYRGTEIPSLAGWFVVSDFCSGKVWAVHPDGSVVQLGKVGAVSAIADGPDGTLYVLAYNDQAVLRIDPK